jgi:hypothetical protein
VKEGVWRRMTEKRIEVYKWHARTRAFSRFFVSVFFLFFLNLISRFSWALKEMYACTFYICTNPPIRRSLAIAYLPSLSFPFYAFSILQLSLTSSSL